MKALTFETSPSLSIRPARQGTRTRHSQHVRSSYLSPNETRCARHIRTPTAVPDLSRPCPAAIGRGRGRSGVFNVSPLYRWPLQIRHDMFFQIQLCPAPPSVRRMDIERQVSDLARGSSVWRRLLVSQHRGPRLSMLLMPSSRPPWLASTVIRP